MKENKRKKKLPIKKHPLGFKTLETSLHNFDTLAVYTYIFAAEERMYDAAAPSISIVMIGLLPIIILTRMIRTSRPARRD